ncbi:PREDICTED: uncharacterized protein LOC109211570 [Nicotiana attenuata]|uniref:Uncharacterized protein n=1 Tax=Nicotiana attenuata TaxID=49451 RepID=A0A314KKE4_NICAT|nr:PREDICTED: uncharacterized protein LOC109211570 [Nicotiana attenuata]OIT29274.1 hypothetical protein A4A49_34361 [Nicotiana attenuata]
MDREQEEMQFLGLFDIYIEAYKLIYRWRKIFSQITLSLILPMCFIILAHMEIYHLFFSDLKHSEFQLLHTHTGTAKYNKISDHINSELSSLWLFIIVYITFLIIFSLLSTSAVVYTIACIYTSREVNFMKVMSVVPKVWKRVMVTFLCAFVCFFIYNLVAFFSLVIVSIWAFSMQGENDGLVKFVLVIMVIVYVLGSVYLSVIWHLASVVTVLEDSYGVKAMLKSKELLKGKMTIALVFFFKFNLSLGILNFIFKKFVVHGHGKHMHLGMLYRTGFGLLCLLMMFKLVLFGLVIQTIIYFVCKSYHHENIDKSALSDHLEVYLGEYEPLKSKDVQMEGYEV